MYTQRDSFRTGFILIGILLSVFLSSLSSLGFAETPQQEWLARFNGDNRTDFPSKMVADALGHVYVTGYSCRAALGFSNACGSNAAPDYATVKYGPDGTEIWRVFYNNGKSDTASDIAVDTGGNVYVTGTSDSTTQIGFDYATVKYDPNGNELWVRRYRGGAFNNAHAIAVEGAGDVYVTGQSQGALGMNDFATVKYNTAGVEQWVDRYDGGFIDSARAIALDGAGHVYVTGLSCNNQPCLDSDATTIKHDAASGHRMWVADYDNGGRDDSANAIALDGAGNVHITGSSQNSTDHDYITVKYNPSGSPLWSARYDSGSGGFDFARAIGTDPSGNVVVTGGSDGDYATVKYDPAGNTLWARRFNSGRGCQAGGQDEATALAIDPSGNIYVIGFETGFFINYDTVKYDPNGNVVWVAQFDGGSHDTGQDVALDGAGNIFVTGHSWNGANYDFVTIKYSIGSTPTPFDAIAPTTSGTTSPPPNGFGWNKSDVTVFLFASDNCPAGSGVREIRYRVDGGPQTVVEGASASIGIMAEGNHTVEYFAVDNAGNTETTRTLAVKIDKTPPAIVSTQTPAANEQGWNNSNVTVQFTGADDLSGLSSCTPGSVSLTTEGAGQIVSATCTDRAGNSAQASRTVNIDKTMPTLTFGTASPAPNAAGWNNTDVSIPFTASDALSGVAETQPATPLLLSVEGAAVTGSVTVNDRAGNSATFTSAAFKVDKTAPTVTSSQSPAANPAGWNNSDVLVTFAAADALSGGVTCTVTSLLLTGEGAGLTAETLCTDQAGNHQTSASTVRIDRTPPALTMPAFQAGYPRNSSLTLSFGAADPLSGIASSSATLNGVSVTNGQTVALTQTGVNTFTLTAADAAGNGASQSATFTVQSGYQFSGFLSPLTPGGVYRLGRVIPVKFRLTDENGAVVSSAVARLALQQFSGEDPVGEPIDATSVSSADSGSFFRFSEDHYMYNLDTGSLSGGTWQLQAILDDGSVHTIQIGLKTK